MNILFIHQNFPGQFLHLAADLASDPRNKVVALTSCINPAPAGVILRPYTLLRAPAQETHFLLQEQESHILRAEACAAAALQLKHDGFTPDIIIAHPGWGEALFLKEVFPNSKLVIYCEYYYAEYGQDVHFDPAQPKLTFAQRCKLRLKNTTNLLSLEIADAAISPTRWQKSTYPSWAQSKITVIHDGIDQDRLKFNSEANLQVQKAGTGVIRFRPGDEVLSYVARNLEPVRGFQVFMRSLPHVLRQRPNAHAVIIGGSNISYGACAPSGKSWQEHMIAEVGNQLDMRRVHFLGNTSYGTYLDVLSISRVHTYWTVPFVLSWSFLEAAIAGMPVIASATPPVQEFSDELDVQEIDFFDHLGFSDAIVEHLSSGPRPRETKAISRCMLSDCVNAQKKLLATL